MNFSGYELQIFVSVLIVLGCAFVALLVDYLKGSNEKLRESHVDLLARQDSVVNRASADTSMLLKALGEQTSALRAMVSRPIHVTSVAAPAMSAPVSLANFPVTSIPTPRREPVAALVPELEKVRVALIPETRVVNPEPTPVSLAPLPILEAIPEVMPEAVVPEAVVPKAVVPKPVVPKAVVPEAVVAESVALIQEAIEVKQKAAPIEEVLPPNVIRIRLMPEAARREPKSEPILSEEPILAEAAVTEAVGIETVQAEALRTEALRTKALQIEAEQPTVALEAIVAEAPMAEPEQAPEILWEGSINPAFVEPEPLVAIPAVTEGPIEEPALAAVTEPEPLTAEPDFERFLDDLVTEFESQPGIYRDLPTPEQPAETPLPEPMPVQSLSSQPILPTLDFQPASELLAEGSAISNLEEFTPNLDVPLGTHAPAVLAALLERKEFLTGLVVSVGINEYGQIHENLGRAAADELLRSVDGLMSSLASEDGFCTRKSADEFTLIFPKLSASSAQRRLSELSERLWDFQLRNLGTFSVVFSWGASEAQREQLSEALASATERMMETQSSRRSVSMDRSRRRRATA